IRPRPTTTSEAATAITASAQSSPGSAPPRRANVISARFAPLSMISSESRTISGLRRSRTPSAPVENRKAATTRYQATSGPCTGLLPAFHERAARVRVRAEDDGADGCDEQHDRRDLERQQVVGQEQPPDLVRRAETGLDFRLVRELSAGLEADDDDHLDEDRAGREPPPDLPPGRSSGPGGLRPSPQVRGHEEEHDHHRARVDQSLSRRDEL